MNAMRKNREKKVTVFALCVVLVGLFAISGCDKLRNVNVDELSEAMANCNVWVYYDETQCSDKWGSAYVSENEKKQNVTMYLENLNIHIYDILIVNDGMPEFCSACSCKTGFRIHCKVKKDDLSKIKTEKFYE